MNKKLRRITPKFKGNDDPDTDYLASLTPEKLVEDVEAEFEKIYEEKEKEIGEPMREIERTILLRVVDNLWMDQIDAMDQLKEGIGLRAIGQQDPVAAYAKEGFEMFDAMNSEIAEETVTYCYNVSVQTESKRHQVVEIGEEKKSEFVDEGIQEMEAESGNGPSKNMNVPDRDDKPETVRRDHPKIGRNDPCWCGSGKKYKNCHMKQDQEEARKKGHA